MDYIIRVETYEILRLISVLDNPIPSNIARSIRSSERTVYNRFKSLKEEGLIEEAWVDKKVGLKQKKILRLTSKGKKVREHLEGIKSLCEGSYEDEEEGDKNLGLVV